MAGRPLKYKTVEELEDAIDEYFESNPEKPTQSGLALALGFADRRSLYDYKERERFSYTIKKALQRIDEQHEKRLYEAANSGSIFYLKNRGWTDRLDLTTEGKSFNKIEVEVVNPESTG